MTDEQRKSVAIEYLKAFDNGGVTSTGGSILDLFADDAQVYFPKWGLANGKEQIGQCFGDVGGTLKSIVHHYSNFNWIFSGSDFIVCEGGSHGEHKDGPWRAGVPEWGAGRWCDVFEIRDWKIQRCFIYLDPDYAGKDTARYPWLEGQEIAAMLLRIDNLQQSLRLAGASPTTSRSSVAEGEALGIIGPNGAGKTTLFSLITGAVGAAMPAPSRSTGRTSPASRRRSAALPASAARTRCRIPSRS